MIINGIACLVVAAFLLFQIYKTQGIEKNQLFAKFIWIYWAILVLVGFNHVTTGAVLPFFNGIVRFVGPTVDLLHVSAGLLLSLYLSKKRQSKLEPHEIETRD